MKKILTLRFLKILALIVLVIGAFGSLDFTLHAGQNNRSVLLVLFFLCWVLSPFIGLLVVNVISKNWLDFTRRIIYWLILVISPVSLLVYSGILSLHATRPAFVFLVFPLLSWLLIIIVIPVAASMSRKRSRGNNSP